MDNERFVSFDDGEYYYISDTEEHNKTLEEFKNELMKVWKDELEEGETSLEDIEEMAQDEYYNYLYDHSMDGHEVVDMMNRQEDTINELKRDLKTVLDKYECATIARENCETADSYKHDEILCEKWELDDG